MSLLRRMLLMPQAISGYCTYLSNQAMENVPIVYRKNVLKITDVDTGEVLLERDPPSSGEADMLFSYKFLLPGEHHVKIELWPEVLSLANLFKGCHIIQADENLLTKCVNLQDVRYMFQESYLREIPPKFFENNPLIYYFYGTFQDCYYLTGETPNDKYGKLWERQGQEGLPSSINGTSCFENCMMLTDYNSIPYYWKS